MPAQIPPLTHLGRRRLNPPPITVTLRSLFLGLILLCMSLPLPAAAQEILSASEQSISLNVGEAKFIRLPEAATAVFLSAPDVADVDLQSARYLYLVGKSIGSTDLYVLGAQDKPLVQASVDVDIDLHRLQSAVNRTVREGNIALSTVDGAVFLEGTVRTETDARAAEDVVTKLVGDAGAVINNLALTTPAQVNLQVTIAEVSRSINEDLGISLSASSSSGNRSLSSPASSIGGFQVSVNLNGGNLGLVLDALAKTGLATILSEPNLTARSGETATFLAGGKIPFRTGATTDDTRVEFQNIGVELEFTPTVFGKDQIEIALNTRVREIDTARSTETDQALSERSASTTIELGSGQSFAIAGMYRADQQQSLSEMPGLAKLPVIGALFRSSAYSRGETELVIIVTPYVVEPTTRQQLRTPVDGLRPVSGGIEQMATGQMVRPGTAVGATSKSRAGFLISR